MESLTVGTFVGAGSFRCSSCGYVLALTGLDTLTACPSCGGEEFARASLFNTARIVGEDAPAVPSGALAEAEAGDWKAILTRAREQWDVEYSEVPSILISKTTLPAKPKVVVLPGR